MMSQSSVLPSRPTSRPSSEQLCYLHIYKVPQKLWRTSFNNILNQAASDTVSLGIITVHPEILLLQVRSEIQKQLDISYLRNYVFLRSCGRSITRLTTNQEFQLKVKHFMPPSYCYGPELFLLEVATEELQSVGTHQSRRFLNSANRSLPKLCNYYDKENEGNSQQRWYQIEQAKDPSPLHLRSLPLPRIQPHSNSPVHSGDVQLCTHSPCRDINSRHNKYNSDQYLQQDVCDSQKNTDSCDWNRKTQVNHLHIESDVKKIYSRSCQTEWDSAFHDSSNHHPHFLPLDNFNSCNNNNAYQPRDVNYPLKESNQNRPPEFPAATVESTRKSPPVTYQVTAEIQYFNSAGVDGKDSDFTNFSNQAHFQPNSNTDSVTRSKYDDCNIGYPFHDVHVHNNSFGNLDHGQQQKDNQEEHQQMYVEGHRIREGDYDRMFAVKGRERSEVAGRRMQESINNSLAIAEGNREACDEVQNKDKEGTNVNSSQPMLTTASAEKVSESERQLLVEEKRRLAEEMGIVTRARQRMERDREDLVKRAKHLQTKAQNKRSQARDMWKKRYFEEKKKTMPLEEIVNRCQGELEALHRKLMSMLEGPSHEKKYNIGANPPSQKSNYGIQCTKLQHDIDDVKRRVENAKMKLTAEMKLRKQAEVELRSLRAELAQNKLKIFTRRSQHFARLNPSRAPAPDSLVGSTRRRDEHESL